MKKWIIIAIVVIALLVIPGLIRFSQSQEQTEKEDGGVPVVVTTATVKDAIKTMSFSSQVEGIEQAQIYPDIPGRFL
ncbi:MAG: hypothetical protein P8Y30_08020, partial [candidate division WOR-3 bacterium]